MDKTFCQNLDSTELRVSKKLKSVDTIPIVNVTGSKIIYEISINPGFYSGNEAPKTTQQVFLQPAISIGGLKFNTNIQLNSDDLLHGRWFAPLLIGLSYLVVNIINFFNLDLLCKM